MEIMGAGVGVNVQWHRNLGGITRKIQSLEKAHTASQGEHDEKIAKLARLNTQAEILRDKISLSGR